MPKRKFEVALAIGGEGSQEGKGCACQAVKADAEDYEVLQGAVKPPILLSPSPHPFLVSPKNRSLTAS